MKEVAMELEGLVIMGKHPWGNANVNTEEIENLLNTPTQSFNIDVCTNCSSSTRCCRPDKILAHGERNMHSNRNVFVNSPPDAMKNFLEHYFILCKFTPRDTC
uniref:Uncharacterized protein n=1 Tax=Quercus lobata TaxID=97700 RepID=A0A7N2RAU9_QUELO